jgi:hypothetical protein
MQKIPALCGAALLCLAFSIVDAQMVDSTTGKVLNYPTHFFGKLQARLAGLNNDLAGQTQKYLEKMARREARLQKKISSSDSTGAKRLFAGSAQQYATLIQKLKADTGSRHQVISGQYQPYVDSLQGELGFLKKNPQLLGGGINTSQLQGSVSQLQAAQAKLQDANEAKVFIQQRRQQISQYLSQHTNLQSLTARYTAGINRDAYYYGQQVNECRAMLNDPDKMEAKALAMVSRLPAYQTFMRTNSQLSGLFKLPGGVPGSGSAQPLPGLQTHSQISQQVESQVMAAAGNKGGGDGAAGLGSLSSKVQSARSQLDSYKSRLSQLGAGSTLADVPSFRPNDQKTKTFWRRLEYGVNFQTTTSSYYYPTTTDLGLSLGYRLGHSNIIGVGASYKIGWGSDIHHIAVTGQGVGLRSFVQIGIKSGFSATGGFEYNYATPFTDLQQLRQLQYWTRSGLIGLSKTVSMKSRVFKKTQVQLLWDFLSYQQVPKGQPVVFRLGYNF